jgi:hypothetical protein
MKRVVRTVIISAVVISAVTAALAVAETGRYSSAKQIPTVLTAQRPSAAAESSPAVAATAPAPATAVPVAKAAPKHKSSSGSSRKRPNSSTKKPTPSPPPAASSKKTEGRHAPEREVVNHSVRDQSDEHHPSSESGAVNGQSKPSSD